ncbi:MAG TPA: hypothetical protein VM889_09700 [Candidatus Thermoplasmatota archaeon]|nr:hypothetical protein [Candidatus Thermoplasmatota archaeon]
MKFRALALAAIATALFAAPAAQAIYMVTPLTIQADEGTANVGDAVPITVTAYNDSTQADWAGKTIAVRLFVVETEEEHLVLESLALDEKAAAAFTWDVPAYADDKNVVLLLKSDTNETLARRDFAIGDAEPIYRLMAESGPGNEKVSRDDSALDTGAPPASPSRTPGPAALALVGAGLAAALGLALARRR